MSSFVGETRGQQAYIANIAEIAEHRDSLLSQDDPKVSLPSSVGKLVIVVSGAPGSNKRGYDAVEHAAFIEEGERLAVERAHSHGGIEIRHRAVYDEVKEFFDDPEVSDITLIGHGSISKLWLDSGAPDFNWLNASKDSNHLKTGQIEQRMCGHFGCAYTVPLGTFAVAKFSNVKAALGKIIPDGEQPPDSAFHSIFSDEEDIMDQIASLNSTYIGRVIGDSGELITSKEYYGLHYDAK